MVRLPVHRCPATTVNTMLSRIATALGFAGAILRRVAGSIPVQRAHFRHTGAQFVAVGEATAWEIWDAMVTGARPEAELRRRMLTVIGALDVLEEDGACRTARREDGVLVHAATRWTS